MFLQPRRASALVHHQVSRVLRLVLQRVHCHVWVVRHPRSYQQGGATCFLLAMDASAIQKMLADMFKANNEPPVCFACACLLAYTN